MAFPGTYNISYYKGDTLEFVVYPKDSSGNAFDLTDFYVKFTVANKLGTGADVVQVPCVAEKATGSSILCAITPANGASLNAGTQYVYDVEIFKPQEEGELYPRIYTILRGTVTVTDQVTQEYVV